MTPGEYLKLRREHAGVTVAQAAERLAGPRFLAVDTLARRSPRQLLESIEDDRVRLSPDEVRVLKYSFRFDAGVLRRLERGEQARICRRCGCSEFDPCVDDHNQPCSWAAVDRCSACKPEETAHEA